MSYLLASGGQNIGLWPILFSISPSKDRVLNSLANVQPREVRSRCRSCRGHTWAVGSSAAKRVGISLWIKMKQDLQEHHWK